MRQLDAVTRRVLVAHAVAALAVALPWPLLLVLVDERSDAPLLLGLVGAARMLPYVLCSWATARLADALRRDLIVRVTLVVRLVLLGGAAVAVATDHVWVAVGACTVAVAVGTPAYPAQVAAMPGLAGPMRREATDLLVTIEVAAFVVGAAFGGLLLHPATRDLLPWVPALMILLALVLVLPVSMPAPVRAAGALRPSAGAALRAAPEAMRAIAVMAAVNLVVALVAVALLPLALDEWSSDAAGYGLATGVLGFAAFGAPVLRRLGRSPGTSVAWGLCLMALGLVLVAPVPTLAWSLAPLALAGAAAVSVEAGATAVLQEHVPDEVRATVLGLNDTVIIAAALLGSLVAPSVTDAAGGATVLVGLAAATLVVAWWAQPRDHAGLHQSPTTVGSVELEAHGPAQPTHPQQPSTAGDVTARRTALRRERLLAVERRQLTGDRGTGDRQQRPAVQPVVGTAALRRPG